MNRLRYIDIKIDMNRFRYIDNEVDMKQNLDITILS